MASRSRTEKSIRNLIFSFGGQGLGLILSMVSRVFFVRYLTVEYLGLSGLFSNILTMLSLVELGIGPAMTYSLYQPLAVGDVERIKSLMNLYKKLYRAVGSVIFALGFAMLPLYPCFMKDTPDIPHLNLIFLLYAANTGISYFYSYRKALVDADQNRYISICFQYTFVALTNIFQIAALAVYQNFIVYMVIQVAFTWIHNFCLARYAGRMYPYLDDRVPVKVQGNELAAIKRNVGAMIFHKLGSIVVISTDNILISKILGLASAGLFSNYDMITKTLNTVLYQIFDSIVASVGNLNVSSEKSHMSKVFYRVFFIDFWIYGLSSICLFVLLSPFIRLWLGSKYVLDSFIVTTLVVKFYMYGMLKAVRTFRDAAGLYYEDRYKPVLEIIINLAVSIILVYKIGMAGIFVGTIISTVATCFWIEPFILYRHCLGQNLRHYFIQWGKYLLYTIIAGAAAWYTCTLVSGYGILAFIIKGAICFIAPNVIFIAFMWKTDEMKYFSGLGRSLINRINRKNIKEE